MKYIKVLVIIKNYEKFCHELENLESNKTNQLQEIQNDLNLLENLNLKEENMKI